MICLLVRNSYVESCGQLYKQEKGISMGINPAMFMATYLLSKQILYLQCFK
jgi:hypothetical protein